MYKKMSGILILGSAIVAGYYGLSNMTGGIEPKTSVTIPELSIAAQAGARAFKQNCATCHGESGAGSEKGPPLIHSIYNPGHHSDRAFFLAAQNGVRSHHWNFGNMPPLRHISSRVMTDIVAYIREIQRANGISTQKHKM